MSEARSSRGNLIDRRVNTSERYLLAPNRLGKIGAECPLPHWKVEEQPNKKPKKGDDKSAVAIARNRGPSLGKIQVKILHQRSPPGNEI